MTLDRILQIRFYSELGRQGWIPFKQWRAEEAERQGVTEDRILKWVAKGKYPALRIKRINRKMVFVKP